MRLVASGRPPSDWSLICLALFLSALPIENPLLQARSDGHPS
jgi:hypothetical protein